MVNGDFCQHPTMVTSLTPEVYTLFAIFDKNREQNFSKSEDLFTETFVLQQNRELFCKMIPYFRPKAALG
jgi:hypothetical protein